MDTNIVALDGPASDQVTVTDDAFAATLFRSMGVDGVQARTGLYEDMIERLAALITELRPAQAEVLRFPPVMSRSDLEKAGYLGSFPNLLGCVCALHGSNAEIEAAAQRYERGEDWTTTLAPADLVLTPASCYPTYPLAAKRGRVPAEGLHFDVGCDCFRREPSKQLDRLQSFRMREYVRIGRPEQVVAFRTEWIEHGRDLADKLGLPATIAPANDPFFGREGRIKAVSQIHQALKFELLVPIYSAERPTACMSFNYHRDHFGLVWELRDEAGDRAHTGCAAFGMDRLALAVFAIHGLDPTRWPVHVRRNLGL